MYDLTKFGGTEGTFKSPDVQQVKHWFMLWCQGKVSFIILSSMKFRLASKC